MFALLTGIFVYVQVRVAQQLIGRRDSNERDVPSLLSELDDAMMDEGRQPYARQIRPSN